MAGTPSFQSFIFYTNISFFLILLLLWQKNRNAWKKYKRVGFQMITVLFIHKMYILFRSVFFKYYRILSV